MRKLSKILFAGLVLALSVALSAPVPAQAAQESRVDVKGGYVTITNVVEEQPTIPLYRASAPATVTFRGEKFARERIEYFAQGEVKDGNIHVDFSEGYVQFDVQQYTENGQVYSELEREYEDIPKYVTGNYATLTKPGYYVVAVGPEAVAPTLFVIQIAAEGAQAPAGGASAEEPAPAGVPESERITAVPTPSKVLVDGQERSFKAYKIDGNNYFKLRDLAMVLRGTAKEFEVTWDGKKNMITLLTGQVYTAVGGELAVSANPEARDASLTTAQIRVNGEAVQLTAYLIDGNNYFKLRDVARVINFGVTWEAQTNTIGILSGSSYSE